MIPSDERPSLIPKDAPKPLSRFQKLRERLRAPTKASIVEQIRRARTLKEVEALLSQTTRMNLSSKTQKRVLAASKMMIGRFTDEEKTP